MRTRSRTVSTNVSGLRNTTTITTFNNGSPPSKVTNIAKVTSSITERSESITDSIAARPEVYVDPKTLKWRRIKYPNSRYLYTLDGASRLFGKNRTFRPIQDCTHTKTVNSRDGAEDFVVVLGVVQSDRTIERTKTYANPWLYLKDNGFTASDPSTYFNTVSQAYSAGAYKQIDWFALSDSFEEACDSFTKAKFLAGESIYESAIFVDAFKILINPTNAFRVLLKNIGKHVEDPHFYARPKFKKMNLGQFVRSVKGMTKKGVNAHLFYDFGVKPAIDDVKATFAAHSFVSGRLKYLQNHSGSWVPIRVKKELLSEVSNTPPGSLAPGVTSNLFCQINRKMVTGTISAWGRVREDLDWNDTWSAYMQYFGIGRLVGLAWELVPFSFVVDWFTNTQEHVNNLTRLRTGGPFYGIRSLCASLKEETEKTLWLNPGRSPADSMQITNPVGPVQLASQKQVTYSRFSKVPTTSGFVDFSNLGLFHYIKTAELILQKLI